MSSTLNRIVQMDAMIRAGRYPGVAEFAARFEVSRRTVYADIDYFKSTLRAPLHYSRGQGGYYYADPTWALPTVIATQGELLAFFLGAELARRYLGTSFEAPLRAAIAKLAGHLPEKMQLDLGQLTQHFTFQPGATAGADPALLAVLSEAVVEQRPLAMTYFTASRGERTERTIEPYHLYNVRGDWQVIAFDRLRGQFRNFAASNIERWTLLDDERFTRDAEFSPAAYLAQGFLAEHGDVQHEVVIWFDAYQARYIRNRIWHPTQALEEHGDGTLTLRFHTGALGEVRRWAMSFGSHAAVRAPAQLAAEVADELRAALRFYQKET
jgi:predicted DNA-binding transcriptional regulator YafY